MQLIVCQEYGTGCEDKGDEHVTTLAERAEAFEKYLDSVRDEDGLVYSDIKADELRPWRNEDLAGKGYDIWVNWQHDPAGCLSYEDCLMGTGRYVFARILKHLISGGDKAALDDAERGVRAILAVSREGDKIEDGFLPKPFGSIKKASLSKHNMSCDQYEHATFALWSFRKACPDSPLAPDIESALVRWTEYFVRKDFSYLFHGYRWAYTDPTERDDGFPTSVGRHALGLYFPMCVMCREITGDARYDDLIHNRLLPSLKRFVRDPTVGFSGHSNSCNLLGYGMYFCWKNGVVVEEAKQVLKMCWQIAEKRLSRYDGLEYDYAHAGASDDHPLEPHYLDKPLGKDQWKFSAWVSNVKTASSAKTAHTGVLLERIEPNPQRADTIRRILDHYRKPQDFMRWLDADGRQVPPEQAWQANTIPSQFVGAWLQAYYLRELPRGVDGL